MTTKTAFNTNLPLVEETCKKIPPLWPLENFVAVNPYLGLSDRPFESAVAKLASLGGIKSTLDTKFYLDKIATGRIKREDIKPSLVKRSLFVSVDSFIHALNEKPAPPNLKSIKLVVDIASETTARDWNRFSKNRISQWAASYFDLGQASWSASFGKEGAYASWKAEAAVDRTPELTGLKKFRTHVKRLPDNPWDTIEKALNVLQIPRENAGNYFHALLLNMGGWASHCARLDWEGRLYKNTQPVLPEFLAVLLGWEVCLFRSLETEHLIQSWQKAKHSLELNAETKTKQLLFNNLILQEAFDRAMHREMIDKFEKGHRKRNKLRLRPKIQAIFCIDVRSEVFRRNLEMSDPDIETLGFAGFFGFPVSYRPLGESTPSAQCPVLLKPGPIIEEVMEDERQTQKVRARRALQFQLKKLWIGFKSGAVTCFSFVSPLGLSFLPKLFTDSFGITRTVPHPHEMSLSKRDRKHKAVSLMPVDNPLGPVGMSLEDQVQLAKKALRAMSLTENFAPIVLVIGHGSSSVNNPHATGLDCGACGGHTGEANARVASEVLNNPNVRRLLSAEGIELPDDTFFIACQHNTANDEVTLLSESRLPGSVSEKVKDVKRTLHLAGRASRAERAMRMNVDPLKNVDKQIQFRSRDWSQVRPEWGLAGCSTFIVAPRERTKYLNFGGKSFLHTYEWKKDRGFATLELIMTAPMVVTSWINLQYFASSVDNTKLGAGNKTLHNITSGLGVLEGCSGDLRTGLPWQSVHDGEKFQHEPVRLSVVIEAPDEAINQVLLKHRAIKDLVDNEWIYLFTLDNDGIIASQYSGNLKWEGVN